MESQIFIDLLRFSHLIAISLGLGLSLYLDMSLLRALTAPLKRSLIETIERAHEFVTVALFALWATGVGLLFVRTGFALEAFTPKLMAKLFVVSALTLNAAAIDALALPRLRRLVGRRFADAPLADRLVMSMSAAVSGCSWFAALSLGVFAVLKPLDGETLGVLAAALYGAGLSAAAILAIGAPIAMRAIATSGPGAARRRVFGDAAAA